MGFEFHDVHVLSDYLTKFIIVYCICFANLNMDFVSFRRELEEQAMEYEEMYEKRMKVLQQSVKRSISRKRRRQDDGECNQL